MTAWRTVPVEPTEAMLEAGYDALSNGDGGPKDAADCWSAMLAAAPKPPAVESAGEVERELTPTPWPKPTAHERAQAIEMANLSFMAMDDETYTMMAHAIAVGRVSALRAAPRPGREAIKALWVKHGGRQHGPNVKQYYIEERAFYRFVDALFGDGAGEGSIS